MFLQLTAFIKCLFLVYASLLALINLTSVIVVSSYPVDQIYKRGDSDPAVTKKNVSITARIEHGKLPSNATRDLTESNTSQYSKVTDKSIDPNMLPEGVIRSSGDLQRYPLSDMYWIRVKNRARIVRPNDTYRMKIPNPTSLYQEGVIEQSVSDNDDYNPYLPRRKKSLFQEPKRRNKFRCQNRFITQNNEIDFMNKCLTPVDPATKLSYTPLTYNISGQQHILNFDWTGIEQKLNDTTPMVFPSISDEDADIVWKTILATTPKYRHSTNSSLSLLTNMDFENSFKDSVTRYTTKHGEMKHKGEKNKSRVENSFIYSSNDRTDIPFITVSFGFESNKLGHNASHHKQNIYSNKHVKNGFKNNRLIKVYNAVLPSDSKVNGKLRIVTQLWTTELPTNDVSDIEIPSKMNNPLSKTKANIKKTNLKAEHSLQHGSKNYETADKIFNKFNEVRMKNKSESSPESVNTSEELPSPDESTELPGADEEKPSQNTSNWDRSMEKTIKKQKNGKGIHIQESKPEVKITSNDSDTGAPFYGNTYRKKPLTVEEKTTQINVKGEVIKQTPAHLENVKRKNNSIWNSQELKPAEKQDLSVSFPLNKTYPKTPDPNGGNRSQVDVKLDKAIEKLFSNLEEAKRINNTGPSSDNMKSNDKIDSITRVIQMFQKRPVINDKNTTFLGPKYDKSSEKNTNNFQDLKVKNNSRSSPEIKKTSDKNESSYMILKTTTKRSVINENKPKQFPSMGNNSYNKRIFNFDEIKEKSNSGSSPNAKKISDKNDSSTCVVIITPQRATTDEGKCTPTGTKGGKTVGNDLFINDKPKGQTNFGVPINVKKPSDINNTSFTKIGAEKPILKEHKSEETGNKVLDKCNETLAKNVPAKNVVIFPSSTEPIEEIVITVSGTQLPKIKVCTQKTPTNECSKLDWVDKKIVHLKDQTDDY